MTWNEPEYLATSGGHYYGAVLQLIRRCFWQPWLLVRRIAGDFLDESARVLNVLIALKTLKALNT